MEVTPAPPCPHPDLLPQEKELPSRRSAIPGFAVTLALWERDGVRESSGVGIPTNALSTEDLATQHTWNDRHSTVLHALARTPSLATDGLLHYGRVKGTQTHWKILL